MFLEGCGNNKVAQPIQTKKMQVSYTLCFLQNLCNVLLQRAQALHSQHHLLQSWIFATSSLFHAAFTSLWIDSTTHSWHDIAGGFTGLFQF